MKGFPRHTFPIFLIDSLASIFENPRACDGGSIVHISLTGDSWRMGIVHSNGKVRHLLVVDDHDDTRFITARLLENNRYSVVTAANIAVAIELSKYVHFDLLIADVELPDGSGLDLLSAIRKRYPIEGIVVSGHGYRQHVDSALAAGFSKHFLKPVNFPDLLRTVDHLVTEYAERANLSSTPELEWDETRFRKLSQSLAADDRRNLLSMMKQQSGPLAERMSAILLG